jgi:osmotically-inducible protein OsmY
MFADLELKQHVEDELGWEPSVDDAAIGVSVKDAVVTLAGRVGSYPEKAAAETAVLRVRGVKALASELEVELLGHHERSDEDIARNAANTLGWYSALPTGALKVKVSKGWLTISGNVDWHYQRAMAEGAVSHLIGVRGVINDIQVKPVKTPTAEDVKLGIEAALRRSAEMEARRIHVAMRGETVVLSGTVDTWAERTAAERAAWGAAGVSRVENDIAVGEPVCAL